MGDSCYMSVTCRRQDKERFEKLGFKTEYGEEKNTAVIEMIDEEANYAHHDEMPADIPYTALHNAGCNYGAGSIACDGKHYVEIAATSDGFVVDWDYRKMKPRHQSLKNIRQFIRIERRAGKILKKLRQSEPHEHVFSPTTHLCHHCGISAEDDLLENQPCIH